MANCIVIGAGPGLGGAIARRFGAGGYQVGLIARSPDKLAEHYEELSAKGVAADWAAADAGDSGALEAAIEQLQQRMGACDVLIYNAAVLRSSMVLKLTLQELQQELSVNLFGAHQAVRQVAPGMITRGAGAILFTGGGLALEPYPEWASLALGKAALRSYSFSLFKELAPSGVHVSVIAVCGIVAVGGLFDPDRIAEEYWRLATRPEGMKDRELIIQPTGSDPFYNDPQRVHRATKIAPDHIRAARQD